MDGNEPKKWHKDYAILLKCWSMIKTSELLRELATNQLSSFVAEEKAFYRLQSYVKKIDSKPILNQTIALWQRTINQYIKQNNFLAAAQSLERLSEIQLSHGSDDQKKDAIRTLIAASKYYKKASEKKMAIIAIKRALTLIEFSAERDDNSIADKYEECGALYKSLNLHHLAELNQKTADFFGELTPYFQSCGNLSNSESDSDERQTKEDLIDNKKLVQKQIREMLKNTANSPMATTRDHKDNDSDYPNSGDNSEELFQPIHKKGSKNLLRKNLDIILSKSINNSGNKSNESPLEVNTNDTTLVKKEITTEITMAPPTSPLPSPTPLIQSKRKRRLKLKEDSEETPAKRIKKLERRGLPHQFIEDRNSPETRLFCILCKDSVYSYRWSTVVDHLETRKHKYLKDSLLTQTIVDEYNSIFAEESCGKNNDLNDYTNYDMNWNSIQKTYFVSQGMNNFEVNTIYEKSQTSDLYYSSKPSTSTQITSFSAPLTSEPLSLDLTFDYTLVGHQFSEQSNENTNRGTLNTPDPKLNGFPLKPF